MKIAVFGGSFNPPHLGHQIIASQILDFTPAEEVWLTPCYKHTFAKDLASTKHRSLMTKMITSSKINYSHLEIENKLSGETIELMELLNQKYPEHEFSFVIGSDNLKYFKKWQDWEKLVSHYVFYVFPRPGFDYQLGAFKLDKPAYQFKLIKNFLVVKSNISSTIIRKKIKKNLSIHNLVPKEIEQYIKKNMLYE